jgi:hypothetical protein
VRQEFIFLRAFAVNELFDLNTGGLWKCQEALRLAQRGASTPKIQRHMMSHRDNSYIFVKLRFVG